MIPCRSAIQLPLTIHNLNEEPDPDTGVDDQLAHPFDQLPMAEIMDNEERIGVFDDLISLVDDLDSAMSAKANDSDSFAASVLKVINSELDDDQLEEIKSSRILNLIWIKPGPIPMSQRRCQHRMRNSWKSRLGINYKRTRFSMILTLFIKSHRFLI